MPHNKPRKENNQHPRSSLLEEDQMKKPAKQKASPPSLNGVPKL